MSGPALVLVACAVLFATSAVACQGSRGGNGAGDGDGGSGGGSARKGDPLRVAAASDLASAFKEVGDAFERSSGKTVELSFGSTGLLAKQITEGAPYDVFAAANVSYADDVIKSGACNEGTKKLYAKGRIVMWSADKKLLPPTLEGLRDVKLAKIAIANPEHAPYGLAAQQAMTKAGVWASVLPRAVYGENVQQTMMFAQSGNADVAIIALSLAMTSGGSYVPIDADLHAPLDQAMVICKGGSGGGKPNEARAFVDFVASDQGHAIMKRYGFLLPGDALPAAR